MLIDLSLKPGYATGYDDLVGEFYAPCLNESVRYDRAVGYFRSTLYVLVGVAFSGFVLRGGKMRLVCSPELSSDDIEAISRGYDQREVLEQRMSQEVRDVLASPEERPVAELLATLVACAALDIRLAFRDTLRGIFHHKVGIFLDGTNTVSFVGSTNDTYSAWHPDSNHESFELFASWRDAGQEERTARHKRYFESLWRGDVPGVLTRDFPSSAREQLLRVANPAGFDAAAEGVRLVVHGTQHPRGVRETPVRGGRRQLQAHQQGALDDWIRNGYHGIIDHVTGSGKTVTALHAIKHWLDAKRPAIVLVPSEILLNQWHREITGELSSPSPNVLLAGGGSSKRAWEKVLPDFTRDSADLGPRIVLATMQTAASADFRRRVVGGSHLLIVADEVHRMGATASRTFFEVTKGAALGLSATPERYGDPDGSAAIERYFGRTLKPSIGISEAIAAGRLVPYDYHVHRCALTDDEQSVWDKLTEQVRRSYAQLPKDAAGNRVHSDRFRLLLIKRARILKRASSKIDATLSIIATSYRVGDRWLAYCDNQDQLTQILSSLRAFGLPAEEYHSDMTGSRSDTLAYFTAVGGILVAIRCLDEGVDIPAVNAAIILASSTNSREFIQRRGRVLRTAPGKHSAQIHDLLVVPARSAEQGVDEARRTILRTELRRAAQFASYARNRGVTLELGVLARQEDLESSPPGTEEFEDDHATGE